MYPPRISGACKWMTQRRTGRWLRFKSLLLLASNSSLTTSLEEAKFWVFSAISQNFCKIEDPVNIFISQKVRVCDSTESLEIYPKVELRELEGREQS